MNIDTIINDDYKSNTYIVSLPNLLEVLIIDPAGDVTVLYDFLYRSNYQPKYIMLTHEHIDHITGTNMLKENYPLSKIVCTEACSQRIIDPKLNLSHYRNTPYTSVPADIILSENSNLEWEATINYFPWEGHSPGGMIIKINDIIFCGDQFIKGIKTVTNLPGGKRDRVKECFDFLKNNFPPETIIYPGHGDCLLLNELELII